jgi:hypothetical protein
MKKRTLLTIISLTLLALGARSQVLDYENRIDVILSDGVHVTMFGRDKKLGSTQLNNEYFYLPVGLRLSKKLDGVTPEFLFMKYTTEQKADQGGVQGALMHFLMEWGLTPAQETEAQKLLLEKTKTMKLLGQAKLLGAASLRPDVEESFRIISATLTDKTFTPNFVTTGRAPLMPGAKIAVAAKLEKNGAQLLAATFEKTRSITDVSISLRFCYDVIMPAVEGEIIVDWSKVDSLFNKTKRDYTHHDKDDGTMPKHNSLHDDIITDNQKDSTYQSLRSSKAVVINLGVKYRDPSNPVVQKVIEAFMDYFLSSVSDKQFATPPEGQPATDPNGKPYEPSEDLYEYHLDKTKLAVKRESGRETFRLNLRLPIREDWTITENLASWYDGVKSNPKCISSVNLNDPFFQHRDINFILDLDAKDIFEQEVNYVTVNVRKKRTTGNDFNDAVTIDSKYLKDKGIAAQLTYARGEDKNTDLYEYKSQWSLRGGKIWPPTPTWTKGDWQGVTLYPPIYPRNIEFEADIDAMKQMNISRATLQVRYRKFGQEYEDNIAISPVKNEPLVSKIIYTDNDTKGYAYRLVFNHTTKGKLAMDWEAKINDNYVYAAIPAELKDENSDIFKKAIEAGKTIVASSTDNTKVVDATSSVLDLFKDIFGSPKKK